MLCCLTLDNMPPQISLLFPYTTLFRSAVARFGRLDILVNNAGVNDRKRPELYSPEEWRAILEPNLSGAFFAAQARSEEHTSELQSRRELVCRLLLEKKKLT